MLGAAIKKDIQLVLRDRGALLSLFALPVIFILFFGNIFTSGDDDGGSGARIAVYAAPDNPMAERVRQTVIASKVFRVENMDSPEAVRTAVGAQQAAAGLIMGAEFGPPKGTPAELVIDPGAPPQLRGPIEGALRTMVRNVVYGQGWTAPLVEITEPPGVRKPMENPSGFQVAVPGNSVLFGFFLALTVALSIVEERKTGTFRRLLAAPIRRRALLISKLVPFFIIGAAQMAVLFGAGILLFGMRVGGSPLALIVFTLVVVLCATSLGLLIASFSGTQKQVGGVGSIFLLVMGLVGGAMVPRAIMPDSIQLIGLMTPHAWALDGFYELLVREGAGLADVAKEIGALLGFSALFTVVGAVRFRFER